LEDDEIPLPIFNRVADAIHHGDWSDKQNGLLDQACDGSGEEALPNWHKFMVNAIQMCAEDDFERGYRAFAENAVNKRGPLKNTPERSDNGPLIDLAKADMAASPEPEPEPEVKLKSKRDMRGPLLALFEAHDAQTPSKKGSAFLPGLRRAMNDLQEECDELYQLCEKSMDVKGSDISQEASMHATSDDVFLGWCDGVWCVCVRRSKCWLIDGSRVPSCHGLDRPYSCIDYFLIWTGTLEDPSESLEAITKPKRWHTAALWSF
jgi:hypothetical protein